MNDSSPERLDVPDNDLDVEALERVQSTLCRAGVSESIVRDLDVEVDAEHRLTALLAAAHYLLLNNGLSAEDTLEILRPSMNGQAASVHQQIDDLKSQLSNAIAALEGADLIKNPVIYQKMHLGHSLSVRSAAVLSVAQSLLDDGHDEQSIMGYLGDLAVGFHQDLTGFIRLHLEGRED